MEISQVIKSDIDSLKQIARQAVTQTVPITDEDKVRLLKSIETDIDAHLERQDCVYLKAGVIAPVAYVLVKEYWNLAHLFVAPEHQGQAIGKKLLMSALELCRKNSESEFVRVNSSLNAVGFYEKLGFVAHEPEKPVPSFAVPMIYRFGLLGE